MDALDAIKKRRSIRMYESKALPVGKVRAVLDAGRWAPSGLNNQPWRFQVIKDAQKKEGLASFTKYAHVIKDAPVAICVFLDIAQSYNREKDLMAIGACIQNMLLAAHAQGLAACWLGEIINKKEAVQQFLKSDSDLELMAVVTLGYPDEQVARGCRKALGSLVVR